MRSTDWFVSQHRTNLQGTTALTTGGKSLFIGGHSNLSKSQKGQWRTDGNASWSPGLQGVSHLAVLQRQGIYTQNQHGDNPGYSMQHLDYWASARLDTGIPPYQLYLPADRSEWLALRPLAGTRVQWWWWYDDGIHLWQEHNNDSLGLLTFERSPMIVARWANPVWCWQRRF